MIILLAIGTEDDLIQLACSCLTARKVDFCPENFGTVIEFWIFSIQMDCLPLKEENLRRLGASIRWLVVEWHDQKIDVLSQVQECRSNK